ncbi:uncharacterized protein LOC122404512 isoform X2 [Colletes gigas]|uniref:uncharacterized protein LOC122404512 isoform X2 n=1 Tax=Colletes gigas TaxID=935657 RepID=UPI001C9B638C|nr:uncharacterized protein LOC122404512 isoform X2 [Colletes gigas]
MNVADGIGTMSVKDAIRVFTDTMRSLNSTDQQIFLSFIADNWRPEEAKIEYASRNSTDNCRNETDSQEELLRNIKRIATDVRSRIPFDGILSSEFITPPNVGENSNCDATSTKHVDAFLYDNREVDELIDEGKLSNLYCVNYIISHSMSVSAMLYIFHNVLPSLEGKTLLDVGSRLGAVLYGAYIFTSASNIIGVEMNKELCTLQCDMIKKYKMNDRIDIVNERIEDCSKIVQSSDIIVMNNPFEFYVPESVHAEIWKFFKANIQRGTILVTRPSIETTLENLRTGISITKWLKPYASEKITGEPEVFGSLIVNPDEHSDINFYEVM